MLVASFLSPPLANRLAEVTRRVGAELVVAASWAEFERVVRESPVSVAVLDPLADHGGRGREMIRLLEQSPAIVVIAYTQLTVAATRVLTDLAQHGLHEVVFHPFDDGYARFGHVLLSAARAAALQCLSKSSRRPPAGRF